MATPSVIFPLKDPVKKALFIPKILLESTNFWPEKRSLSAKATNWVMLTICIFIEIGQIAFVVSNIQDITKIASAMSTVSTTLQAQVDVALFTAVASYLFGHLLQLFLFCTLGNEIIYNAAKLPNAIFSSRWYDTDLNVQKDVLFVLQRAQRNAKITAMGVKVLDYQTFTAIHQLMLKDAPRNRAYRQAVFENVDQIRGRTILDVGCGTGILSIFCAQAGAAKIYAVEASNVSKIAEEVIKENGFDKVIQVINSRIEDVTLPEKVDIIISEWMGFYLLHEGMLDSVIFARDKFLKPGGLMFPESATLYSAPCCVPSMYDYWENVEGVSMKSFSEKIRSEASHKPSTALVAMNDVLADPEVVLWIDLREVSLDDISSVKIQHVAVATKGGKYQGICLWFTCTFPAFGTEPVTLSTSPEDPETHWKQTTIVLPTQIEVEEKSPIAYELSLARSSENMRRYNIEVTMLDPEEVEHPEYCSCHMTKCILVRAMLEKYEMESLPK